MRALEVIVGLTLSALALYYFIGEADKSSKFMSASADAYSKSINALMGRG
jgi:hypothetical protein